MTLEEDIAQLSKEINELRARLKRGQWCLQDKEYRLAQLLERSKKEKEIEVKSDGPI